MKEKIEKMRIPDEDAGNWINTLRESGFSQDEIDEAMVMLNDEYANLKPEIYEENIEKMAGKEFKAIKRKIEMERGASLNLEQREVLWSLVKSKLKEKL
ncbi:MAG: hypothetical protein U5L10_02835 [Candidatus Moranbacteria bacterium]|nr:hypothetical protein [Candidatus Moranbacteria bacterium]